MDIKLINIGFSSMVAARRITAIADPESAAIKQLVADARERGNLINATYGRRTRGVIITDSGHVILSAVQSETLGNRCRAGAGARIMLGTGR
jgi:extracellular matrix regulatory protein A